VEELEGDSPSSTPTKGIETSSWVLWESYDIHQA
jgi:hypothetical protein